MSVDELAEHLEHHWLDIKAAILAGRYRPQPMRRVEIPKPDGRKRMLGIPTVLDRFIQQAVAQIGLFSGMGLPQLAPARA